MNLKEAFRYHKYLSELFYSCLFELNAGARTRQDAHHRHKVYPAHPDRVFEPELNEHPTPSGTVLRFAQFLIEQKGMLSRAVLETKARQAAELDAETAMNPMRRDLFRHLQKILGEKSTPSVDPAAGMGHYWKDGEQKTYRYDIEHLIIENFDRKDFRRAANAVISEAENKSSRIERLLVTSEVDYVPPLALHMTLQEALEWFAESGGNG